MWWHGSKKATTFLTKSVWIIAGTGTPDAGKPGPAETGSRLRLANADLSETFDTATPDMLQRGQVPYHNHDKGNRRCDTEC